MSYSYIIDFDSTRISTSRRPHACSHVKISTLLFLVVLGRRRSIVMMIVRRRHVMRGVWVDVHCLLLRCRWILAFLARRLVRRIRIRVGVVGRVDR